MIIVNEKWKASASAQNFDIFSKDVPVKDILASVEDGLRGIFPSEADLIHGKMVSTKYETISEVDQFWWKKNTWNWNS